jgi:hypothetical protein
MNSALLSSFGVFMLVSAAAASPSEPPKQLALTRSGVTAEELSREVSQQLGRPFVYVSSDPKAKLSIDLKEVSAADLSKILSKRGAVVIASDDVTSDASLAGARLTLQAVDTEVVLVAEALKRISGGRFLLVPKDSHQKVSLDAKVVSLVELRSALSAFGDTQVVVSH